MNAISPLSVADAVSIPVGTKFILMNSGSTRIYEVKREGKVDITAQNLETNNDEDFQKRELIDFWHVGSVRFLHWAHSTEALLDRSAAQSLQEFNSLPKHDRDTVLIKHKLMQSMHKAADEKGFISKKVVDALSSDARRLYPAVKGLGVSSLYNCYNKQWRPSGGHMMSLLSKSKRRGNRTERFAEEVLQIFFSFVFKHYMRTSRPTAEEVYDAFATHIARLNAKREPGRQLKTPKLGTFREWIRTRLDRYEVAEKRRGKSYARHKYGGYGQAEQATRPLEIVEVDHTPIDFQLISEITGLPCGRAWLTLLIDVYSRCIIGYHVSFDPPSYYSVAMALKHAIQRKDEFLKRFPKVKNEWPCFGLPERLICDNGPEFHSEDLHNLCVQLGVSPEFTQKRTPQNKPHIERVLGTINRLFKNMPATTHANYVDKGEHKSETYASVVREKVEHALARLIVDVYHQRPHRGLKGIPDKMWRKGVSVTPPQLPASIGDLRAVFGRTEHRKLRHDGIEFNTLRYTASVEEMRALRSDPKFPKNGVVEIRYNDDDCTRLSVKHPGLPEYIEFRSLRHRELEGVSFFQYDLLRQRAEQDHGDVNWESISAAREDIRRDLGFYDKKRKRRLTRTETRMESGVATATSEIEQITGRKPSRKHAAKQTPAADTNADPTGHRSRAKGWGSQYRKVA